MACREIVKNAIEAGLRVHDSPANNRSTNRSHRVPTPSLTPSEVAEFGGSGGGGTRSNRTSMDIPRLTSTGGIRGPSLDRSTTGSSNGRKRTLSGRMSLDGSGSISPTALMFKIGRTVSAGGNGHNNRGASSNPSSPVLGNHTRSPSLMSGTMRDVLEAIQDDEPLKENGGGGAGQQERSGSGLGIVAEDEFDKLLNSGQTMKVSLTPSRLKNYDVS